MPIETLIFRCLLINTETIYKNINTKIHFKYISKINIRQVITFLLATYLFNLSGSVDI